MPKKTKAQKEMEENGSIIQDGFKVRLRKNKSGTVSYQVEFGTSGGRKNERKAFQELDGALEACTRRRLQLLNEGTAAVKLTDEQRADTVRAIKKLEGRGISLEGVADYWLSRNPDATEGPSVARLSKDFIRWMSTTPRKLKAKRTGPYREESVTDAMSKLKMFETGFPKAQARAVTGKQITRWLDGLDASMTYKDNLRRAVSMMYSWAGQDGGILEGHPNPVASVPAMAGHRKIPDILTADEAGAFLHALPRLRATYAILFFAGLRPWEVMRLTPKNIGTDEIMVIGEQSKTHKYRLVTVPDNLKVWLKKYRFRDELRTPATFRKARAKACEDSGVTWAVDIPRHCFGTYYSALHGMNRAADEMGHGSTKMLHDHYRGLIRNRRDEAEKYFGILPK